MIQTCKSCPHLTHGNVRRTKMYFCTKTKAMVPQDSDKERAVFHRVPMECPHPDTEVKKRDKPAARKNWETIEHDQG